MGAMDWSAIDWGDAPTWVGTGFAALAAGAAVWTLASQRRQIGEQREFIAEQSANLALEREELRAAAEERRWGQARQIVLNAVVTKGESGLTATATAVWVALVRNASSVSIRNVEMRFGGESPAQTTQEKPAYEVDIGHDVTIATGALYSFESTRGDDEYLRQHPPVMHFEDVHGRRWQLDRFGALTDLS
ncbi:MULTISPECIES: hypothetical protein [Streptomyces]|uniref:hypothetical protein n=1 Tax=Streptomyces lycopersici TaxID=2974589 RepID=UPI0021D14DEB|nr:hypothetical protein [Streptomyces sp. NEAU-383]